MPAVRRTARAEDDLVDIWLYIAEDNPNAADRFLEGNRSDPLQRPGIPRT